MTAALAGLGEAVLPRGSDARSSAQFRECRAHAESWRVVTTGVSTKAGSGHWCSGMGVRQLAATAFASALA